MAALRNPSGKWIVGLDGIGGIGKTTLAREVADRCAMEALFDTIVWIQSPKEQLDSVEYVRGASKDLTFESVLDSIVHWLDAVHASNLAERDKENYVKVLLHKQKVLLVLDDLEKADESENEIVQRLEFLLIPSKALLISRKRFRDHIFSIHLQGLDRDSAVSFIRHEAQNKDIQSVVNAGVSELEKIIKSAGYSPLAIKLVIAQLNYLPIDVVLARLARALPPIGQSDESDYANFYGHIFSPAWNSLSEDAKKLLISMTSFPPNVGGTYEAIKAISGLGGETVGVCIDELWRLSLLEIREGVSLEARRFYIHPLTQYYVLSDVVNTWQKQPDYGAVKQRYVNRFLDYARVNQIDFDALEIESNAIFRAMSICLESSDFASLAEYFDHLSLYLVEYPHWDIFLRYARPLLAGNLSPNKQNIILEKMAKVQELSGNYDDARRLYKQLIQYARNYENNDNSIYRILGESARLAILQRDYIDAKRDLEGKLEIAERRRNKREEVDILFELVKLYRNMGDLDGGYSLWNRCIEIARMISYQTGVAKLLLWKSLALYQTKKLVDATEYCKEALKIASMIGDHSLADEAKAHLEVLNSMLGKRVFISYSHHDRSFVERLATELKTTGIPVWWDEMEIKVGHSIIKKVSEGISGATYLAVVLSPSSIESNFVQRELEIALMGQLSTKKITVLPLLLADCEIPTFLKVIKWADFRTDYQTGLKGLLDTLAES